MPYSHLLVEVDDAGVALVSINRPDKLNALNDAVISAGAPLGGRANSTSERRAGREALAGRPDCVLSMFERLRR